MVTYYVVSVVRGVRFPLEPLEVNEMSKTINKEIHKTEFIDKQLPTIIVERSEMGGMDKGTYMFISVSDKTSEDALKTLRRLQVTPNDQKRLLHKRLDSIR